MSDKVREVMRDTIKLPDAEADSKLVQYTELSAELLGELHQVREERKVLEAREEYLRGVVVRLAGRSTGAIPRGEWVAMLTPRRGSCSLDWERWATDEIGAEAVREIVAIRDGCRDGKMTSKYVKVGKESVSVEVVKNEEKPEV